MDSISKPQLIKDIILNIKTPYIIKNLKLPWKCFTVPIEEWCLHFDNNENEVLFQTGTTSHNNYPQWEKYHSSKTMNLIQFLEIYKTNKVEKQWASYSYKNIEECPLNCREGIDFSDFGFENLSDVSFWLGSKGAHTSCHYDTYGCNIVVQVYGRKSWLLFPPETPLSPTRVPFEESSVYCKENFFSPSNLIQFQDIHSQAYHIILEPGDILIVPKKWWHYVENLETSLSFNTWIPLESDIEAQMAECIVKLQLTQLTNELTDDLKASLINPNELSSMYDLSLESQLELLSNLASFVINADSRKRLKLNNYKSNYLTENELENLLKDQNHLFFSVKNIEMEEFYNILSKNSKRFEAKVNVGIEESEAYKKVSTFINAMCNPTAVDIIKRNYLKEMKQKNN